MAEYRLQPDAVPPAAVEAMRETLLASPLVGRSTLAGSFRHSRGFALTFTREGVPELLRRFGVLAPFVDHALGATPVLRRWRERLRLVRPPVPVTNAFYLNLLLVEDGGSVGRHTDATLRGPSGDAGALPARVTVLYLAVPERLRGGELRLYREHRRVAAIRPRQGALVHFRGDLQHEVTQVDGAAPGALRASLVCEQYALAPEHLSRLAPFQLQSKAGFEAFLAYHQGAGGVGRPG